MGLFKGTEQAEGRAAVGDLESLTVGDLAARVLEACFDPTTGWSDKNGHGLWNGVGVDSSDACRALGIKKQSVTGERGVPAGILVREGLQRCISRELLVVESGTSNDHLTCALSRRGRAALEAGTHRELLAE